MGPVADFKALPVFPTLALVCLLALAACTGEGEQESAPPSPSPTTTIVPRPTPVLTAPAEAGPLGAYVVDVSNGRLTRLTAGEDYSVVSWSRDGTNLTLAQGGLTADQDIYSVNADGSELVVTGTVDGWVGQWSPAGRAIIRYELGRDQDTGLVQYGLYVTSLGARHGQWVVDGFLGMWSPDGRHIAFVGNFCDEAQDYVGVLKGDGSDLVKLADIVDALQVGHAWSPDGHTLAFSAPDDVGVLQIYLVDVESGERVKLTEGTRQKMTPAWSGDGAFLSFASLEGEGPGATLTHWLVPKEGGDAIRLPEGMSDLQWSPQGRRLAFASGGELWVLDPDEGGPPTSVAQLEGSDKADFYWSPDGGRIAFLREGQLSIVEVDGSGEKQLTSETLVQVGEGGGEPLVIDSIRWSPGGTKIAFAVVQPSAPHGVCS
jgi:Tol biopolymer transport system component